MKTLMRGTGRSDGKFSGSDIGLVFATENESTAQKYASWGNDGSIVRFSFDDSEVADLRDENTARKIVEHISTYVEEVNVDEYVRQLVECETDGEIGIMDDFNFSRAVETLGYSGAKQFEDYAIFEHRVTFRIENVQ